MAGSLKAKLGEVKDALKTAFAELRGKVEPQVQAKLTELENQAVSSIEGLQARCEQWKAEREQGSGGGGGGVIEEPALPPEEPPAEPNPEPTPGEPPSEPPEDLPSEPSAIEELQAEVDALEDRITSGLEEISASVDSKVQAAVAAAQETVIAQIEELRATIEGNLPHVEHR